MGSGLLNARSSLAAVGFCFLGGYAFAQTALPPAPNSDSGQLTEIVVTAQYVFLSADTAGTTNLPLPIEKVPQTIDLVSADFIQAANLKTLGDIASYTPGTVNAGDPENNGTVIDIRGFAAGRALDGINAISTYNSFEPDFAIYDRLEIVEGPSSVVYGISSPGGLVNYVTKSATSQTPSYLYVQGGSWDSYRVEGQYSNAIDADGRVRFITVAAVDNGDSFTNSLDHRKLVLYGGLNAQITDTLTGYLHGGYEWFSRPSFDGIPPEADGSPAPLPRSFLIGSPDIRIDTREYYAVGDLTWRPSPMWELNLKSNYENAGLTGGNEYGFGLDNTGDLSFNVTRFDGVQRTVNYGIGASAIVHWDPLGLKDSFLSVSALYQRSDELTNVLYPADQGEVNVFAGQGAVIQAFNSLYDSPLPYGYASSVDTTTATVSAQSVTTLFDHLQVLAGASYAKPTVDTNTEGAVQDYDSGGQMSYRGGLTYEFAHAANAYVSYSESFQPQPLLTVQQTVLPPVSGKQYEAGVKYRPDAQLLLSAAVYHITESNLATYNTSINGVDYYIPLGEVTNEGFELKALGEITPSWQINTGYSYLDPKITRDSDPTIVGRTQLYLPESTFSVYSTYTLYSGPLSGFSYGGGVRYVGAVRTAYDDSTKDISSYTLADINLGYSRGPWLAQLTVSNVFNKEYFINNYQTLYYGNYPGAPASFAISVRRTFGNR